MKNEYKITKDLIKSWAKEYHLHGTANISLFILWCVVGVIGFFGLIFSVAMSLDWKIIYLYALMLIIAIFKGEDNLEKNKERFETELKEKQDYLNKGFKLFRLLRLNKVFKALKLSNKKVFNFFPLKYHSM